MTLEIWCASNQGPLCLEINAQEAVIFIAEADIARAQLTLLGKKHRVGDARLKNYLNIAVAPLYFASYKLARDAEASLNQNNIAVWEADIRPPERFLMERFITGSLRIVPPSQWPPQNTSYAPILVNPKIQAGHYHPRLSYVSVDIETSMDASTLYSIGAYGDGVAIVFMVGNEPPSTPAKDFELIYCVSESHCLKQFFNWLQQTDPDLLIGWNFIQFDLKVLAALCQKHKMAFTIGRANKPVTWREDKSTNRHYIQIPGRVALDGIELLKAATYNFSSFKLEAVAQELLGEGKLLTGNTSGQQITELFHSNKAALATYNLQDCKLVWDIFVQTKLIEFAVARSQLTGLLMDRMGGSVAAFEFAYLPRLHRKGYIAPNLGELHSDIISPGGYVLDSAPGIYKNILVLDFKSLYPSIIRTFHIDPYAYWYAQHQQLTHHETIPGFNTAIFSKNEHLLPTIIKTLWDARDNAKLEKNQPLSQAIKIIMNSFYGVLGSTGCRFYDPRVCSSITLRGHQIIQQTQLWIEAEGHTVIYGDTDSVFVWVGNERDETSALAIGQHLAEHLNKLWQKHLRDQYAIDSALEIEFETHYLKFLMPTIRNSTLGSKKRYAGTIHKNGTRQLIFKGLENVRTDWTPLAKNFQATLYQMVFDEQPVAQYIQTITHEVLAGKRNAELIYRKRLRRNLNDYTKNAPPHVQAARKLSQLHNLHLGRGDTIAYILTVNGPEPVDEHAPKPLSPIAFDEYVERQLKPIADSLLQFIDLSFDEITRAQLHLF